MATVENSKFLNRFPLAKSPMKKPNKALNKLGMHTAQRNET